MCKTLDSFIENPREDIWDKRPDCAAFPTCDGCCFILNWLLKFENADLSLSEFLLACIEKRAELEVISSHS